MFRRALWLFLALIAVPARAQNLTTRGDYHRRFVALANQQPLSDSARLQRLLALDWENTMVEFPEFATSTGYPGQNRRWTDLSVAVLTRRRHEASDRLLVLRAVNRAKLRPADQLNYDLFKRGVEEGIEGLRFPSDLMQITQLGGPQSASDVIAMMPAASARDYKDILARLDALPLRIDQTLVLLDSGMKLGITPPKVTLRDVPSQLENLVPVEAIRSPLLEPFTRFPQTVAAADRERLLAAATRSYTERVRPAFQRLHDYVASTSSRARGNRSA